jgi:hypothetical protein
MGQTTVERHMVAPRRPADLRHIWESFTYTAPGNYPCDRHYQVYDQFNGPYTYDGTPVWESFAISSNGCNITSERNRRR